MTERPLTVAHVIHRLDVGGLESLLVTLINHLPHARYRHAVICLTEHSDFRQRIRHPDVSMHALHKREGKDFPVWWRLFKLLRQLRPDVLHTCNIAALEAHIPGFFAGVPSRVHAEHGRDIYDLDGSRYRRLRRALSPLVHRFVPVSRDLEDWLVHGVGIAPQKIFPIYNGVDGDRFKPCTPKAPFPREDFAPPGSFIIGSVGRICAVKDFATLVTAFRLLRENHPPEAARLRLVLVGDGPERPALEEHIRREGVAEQVLISGFQEDVVPWLASLDIFALSSLAEGTPLTLLEAMAMERPVVVTAVGGMGEVVTQGVEGFLVPRQDPPAMAQAMGKYLIDSHLALRHGQAGRRNIMTRYGLPEVLKRYDALFSF